MANALKKITAAAKAIRKRKPKTSWKSAVKQAGAKYRAGKLRPRRKSKPAAKKVRRRTVPKSRKRTVKRRMVKRKTAKKATAVLLLERGATRRTRPKRVYRVKRTKKGRYAGIRRISGGSGISLKTIALVGLGLGAIYMLTRPKPTPAYIPTANVTRNNQAEQIIAYAQAAGLAATQIANLINALNTRPDEQVYDMYNQVQSGQSAGLLV